ncbi:hypothetical protein [Pedobacter sp. SYP-B3415]|uniref:hypothetical protein n=1 Tax=Pedobacter sp. SYP-B3415 TaxID=2496641 RepID=UPI00101CBE6E|nr:hypothetical protein [Pedobacter sp. SYP-B3415]
MAKSIKVVRCPHCGSVAKTNVKTDHFRCASCNTEYYLDNDDININITGSMRPPSNPVAPRTKNVAYLAILIVVVLGVLLITGIIFTNKPDTRPDPGTATPTLDFSGAGSMLYQNTVTGKAVLMRLAREHLQQADGEMKYVNTHVVFIDPASRKRIKSQILFRNIRRLDPYFPLFYVMPDESVYMHYPGEKLFAIDRQTNQLNNASESLFESHPELGSGIAKVRVDDDGYMELLINTGKEYYYVPKTDSLFSKEKGLYQLLKKLERDVYFQFNTGKLIKLTRTGAYSRHRADTLVAERTFFDPSILFTDSGNLIIASRVNAADDAPVLLQSLNVTNGTIRWTLPVRDMNYEHMIRCKEGFAVQYSANSKLDYISGVLFLSASGKITGDYLIKRNE